MIRYFDIDISYRRYRRKNIEFFDISRYFRVPHRRMSNANSRDWEKYAIQRYCKLQSLAKAFLKKNIFLLRPKCSTLLWHCPLQAYMPYA